MNQKKEDILRHQLANRYHQKSPFSDERARYLTHLLNEGWSVSTVQGRSCELSAFARHVDIAAIGKISTERIEAAAKYCISHRAHSSPFSRSVGRHKARCRFIRAVTDWLRFIGRFKEEPGSPPYPHAALVKEFLDFLAQERGLAQTTLKLRLMYVGRFLAWFDERQRDLSKVSLPDVEKFLASSEARRWNRVPSGSVFPLCARSSTTRRPTDGALAFSLTLSRHRVSTQRKGFLLAQLGLKSVN